MLSRSSSYSPLFLSTCLPLTSLLLAVINQVQPRRRREGPRRGGGWRRLVPALPDRQVPAATRRPRVQRVRAGVGHGARRRRRRVRRRVQALRRGQVRVCGPVVRTLATYLLVLYRYSILLTNPPTNFLLFLISLILYLLVAASAARAASSRAAAARRARRARAASTPTARAPRSARPASGGASTTSSRACPATGARRGARTARGGSGRARTAPPAASRAATAPSAAPRAPTARRRSAARRRAGTSA